MTCNSVAVKNDLWKNHAVRWDLIGPPLRPAPEDLQVLAGVVAELARQNSGRGLTVLMLGVTPEYARFAWPPGTTLVAWERNESMIRHVWPGSTAESARVIQGDWLHPIESNGAFDLVLGDGVLSQLAFPGDYEALGRVLRARTRAGGRWLLRLYAGPNVAEDPQRVLDDVCRERLTNINEFKLRLGMAVSGAYTSHEVAVADVWEIWDQARNRQPELRNRWSPERMATIDSYRDSTVRYTFPPVEVVLNTLRPFARVAQVLFPSYSFGSSCPTVIWEP